MTEPCPTCGKLMQNLGNVNGTVYTSYPPQWDDTPVCHGCQIKKVIRRHGQLPPNMDYLDSYKAA